MWGIQLNRRSELQLKRQLYQSLRDLIISGKLNSGEVLPSTRELSRDLEVSRNTVCEAYEMLIAEGFVISRQGAPTRVAEGVCLEISPEVKPLASKISERTFTADFRTGRPDLRQFPRFTWQQIICKTSEKIPLETFGYTGPQGLPELRREIAAWLFRSRGLRVNPGDIFITAGATHALHIIAELLFKEGQGIIMEDPCHMGMLRTFKNRGCNIIPLPVDEQGMQTEYLTNYENAHAVYVTPSHQFPLGGILPAARRIALIRYAKENGIYVIEDDYDSEFRYCGESIAPLYVMEPQSVIYVGTFSKVLFPALRVGYVILPSQLHKRWRVIRTHADVQNPPFEQAALAEFLSTRKLDRHVRKMRRIYGQRRQVLLESLEENFSRELRAYGDAAGLHLAVEFPDMQFDNSFQKSCIQKGINVTPVESHCIQKGRHLNKLLIGYGHLEPEEIQNGIRLLRNFIKGIS